jgi:hypothetical protein
MPDNADDLAASVLAYDAAIRSCANDPNKMASFCSAEGDDLDALYLAMVTAASNAAPQASVPTGSAQDGDVRGPAVAAPSVTRSEIPTNNAGGRPTETRGDSATQSAAPLSSAPSSSDKAGEVEAAVLACKREGWYLEGRKHNGRTTLSEGTRAFLAGYRAARAPVVGASAERDHAELAAHLNRTADGGELIAKLPWQTIQTALRQAATALSARSAIPTNLKEKQ